MPIRLIAQIIAIDSDWKKKQNLLRQSEPLYRGDNSHSIIRNIIESHLYYLRGCLQQKDEYRACLSLSL